MPEYPQAPRPTLYREVSDILQPLGLIEDTITLLADGGDEVQSDYIMTIERAASAIRSQVQDLLERVHQEVRHDR